MVSRVSTIRAHIKGTTLAAMETPEAEAAAAAAVEEAIVEASSEVRTETIMVVIEGVAMVGTRRAASLSCGSHYVIAVSTSISAN